MVIRSQDDTLGISSSVPSVNQAGASYRRFGIRRMRALELIRQELHSISKYAELNAIQQISLVLRRTLIETMLFIVDEFTFCSSACYEAIEVLDILKIAFDDDNIETLKDFVREHLSSSQSTHFNFESTRRATSANLATIVKIGIALKRLTTAGSTAAAPEEEDEQKVINLDEELDSQQKPAVSVAQSSGKSFQHLNDSLWSNFCAGKLHYFETKWSKKLESYTDEDHKALEQEAMEEVDVIIQGDSSEEDGDI